MPGDFLRAGAQRSTLDSDQPNGPIQVRLPGDVFNRLEIHLDGEIWAGTGATPPVPVASGGAVSSVNQQVGDVQLDAEDIPFTPAGGVAATDTQAAIVEVAGDASAALAAANEADDTADIAQATIDAHILDATEAHTASAISSTPSGGTSATNVQDAIDELTAEKATTASVAAAQAIMEAHILAVSDAHDGSAISFPASGSISADNVTGAIQELDTEKQSASTAALFAVKDADESYTRRGLRFIAGANVSIEIADDAGGDEVEVTVTGTGSGSSLATARATRTSGSFTLNNTSWSNLDTGLDLTIPAVAGDVLGVDVSALWNTQAVDGWLGAVTLVSGAPVNSIGATEGASSIGVPGWGCRSGDGMPVGALVQYVVQAGDIEGGNVVLRLRFRTGAASNKGLNANTDSPFKWSVVNYGQ